MYLTYRRVAVETPLPHAPVAVRAAVCLPLLTQPTPHPLVMFPGVRAPYNGGLPLAAAPAAIERPSIERGASSGPRHHEGGVCHAVIVVTPLPASHTGQVADHVDVMIKQQEYDGINGRI